MAYEGPLLATAIVQATAAIPAAVRSLREILSETRPDRSLAEQKLAELQEHLMALSRTEGWFDEAKQLHQLFQNLSTALEPLGATYLRALDAEGRFDESRYDLAEVRRWWAPARLQFVGALLSAAQVLEHVEERPLRFGPGGAPEGPEWAVKTAELSERVTTMLQEFDRGVPVSLVEFAETANRLDGHVKDQLHLLDYRLRQEVTAFSQALSTMAASLQNV